MALMGLFGGTFDPIHLGHLRTAFECLHTLSLSEVRFIPCGEPPHGKTPRASAELRLAMVRAAITEQPEFVLDEREIQRAGPAFTVDTLESLRGEMPVQSFGLIVGMDAFRHIESWHRYEELLELAHLIVVHRPGAAMPDSGVAGDWLKEFGTQDVNSMTTTLSGRVFVYAVTQLEISSSAIRDAVSRGESPRYLVPHAVEVLLKESNCYRD